MEYVDAPHPSFSNSKLSSCLLRQMRGPHARTNQSPCVYMRGLRLPRGDRKSCLLHVDVNQHPSTWRMTEIAHPEKGAVNVSVRASLREITGLCGGLCQLLTALPWHQGQPSSSFSCGSTAPSLRPAEHERPASGQRESPREPRLPGARGARGRGGHGRRTPVMGTARGGETSNGAVGRPSHLPVTWAGSPLGYSASYIFRRRT